MTTALRAGLSELSAELASSLGAELSAAEFARVERLANATALVDLEFELGLDAAGLWTALGYRLINSPVQNAAELNQALGYFIEAAGHARGVSGDPARAMLTSALIGTAVAYARMPTEIGLAVESNVIAATREAASRCPTGPEWEQVQVALLSLWGDLLSHRSLSDLVTRRDARSVHDLALTLLARRPAQSPQTKYCASVALALAVLRLGDETNAIKRLRQAARMAHSLGNSFEAGRCLALLANALEAAYGAQANPDAARLQLRAAAAFEAADRPFEAADSYRAAGVMLIALEEWAAALRSFRGSARAWEAALEQAALQPQVNEATAMLALTQQAIALCLVRLGRFGQAGVAADRARARRLRAMPRLFSPELIRVRERAPILADQYLAAQRRMRSAEIAEHRMRTDPSSTAIEQFAEITDELRLARQARREVLARMRAVPGLTGTFGPITLSRIRASLPIGAVAAYLVPSPHGGAAILVSRRTLRAVSLPQLTTVRLSGRIRSAAEVYDQWRANPSDMDGAQAWEEVIGAAGRWLWKSCIGPVLRASRGFQRLILMPSGGLEFLPLHAAWRPSVDGSRVYALDVLPISFAPCADLQPATSDGRPFPDRSLLLVADPAPTYAAPLPQARIEAAAIAPAALATTLVGPTATKAALVAALATADLIHLSCHGAADFRTPYASHLLLACSERLDVSDIVDLQLERRPFVFLSTCESGLHDLELVDEAQSLGAAFLSAGATGVISTLWPVFDVSALLMSLMVYDQLRLGNDPLSALRHAQCWMRDSQTDTKATTIEGMAWVPLAVRQDICRQLGQATNDFSSPLYWAAHVYSGA